MKLRHTEIGLPADEVWLDGYLAHSPAVSGLVLLGERSGRHLQNSRAALYALALQKAGFATLQFGLLTHEEERKYPHFWDQPLRMSARLSAIVEWVLHQPTLKSLPLGLATRDAAAAAMIRIALQKPEIRALACRHGRPDLAGADPLRTLITPLLILVGEKDADHLPANRQTAALLSGPHALTVIAGASSRFEEPGTLDAASQSTADWFRRWLTPPT